jgi:hypothetical protein
MDKAELRQCIGSLHSILGHVTSLLHYMQEEVDRMPERQYLPKSMAQPKSTAQPKSIAKTVNDIVEKYSRRSRSVPGAGRAIIMGRLQQGPARWIELQAIAYERGYTSKFTITKSLDQLKKEGLIIRVKEGWALTDGSSVQTSKHSNRTAVE